MKSYRELDVWKLAMDLVEDCYRVTAKFPREENYALRDQIRRAVVSVPSNIAEGFGRSHTAEYVQFVSVARGSLMEVETQVTIAKRLGYLTDEDEDALLAKSSRVGQMLSALRSALRKRQSEDPNR